MTEAVVLLLMNIVITFGVIIMGYSMFGHKAPVPPSEYKIAFTVRPPVDLEDTVQSTRLGGFPPLRRWPSRPALISNRCWS
jgi:hypothetical protein